MSGVELSYSRIQAYQRCPWLYHLVYDEGWRSGPNSSMALGQSLHRALELYFSPDNSEYTLDRLLEFYDQVWVNEGFGSPQETLESYDRGRKMLERFSEIDGSRHSEVLAAEKEFNIPIAPDTSFRGTIDRLDRLPDGAIEIIEYKTQGERWTDERIANDLQMTLYHIGVSEEMKGAEVKLKYYFLSTGESKTTSRTPEQLSQARALLSTVGEQLRRRNFTPNHSYCSRCEFGKRCANFKQGTAQ